MTGSTGSREIVVSKAPAARVSIPFQYPLLTSTNYAAWKTKMRVHMIAQGVWDAVEGDVDIDESHDKMALSAIYQGVSEETLLMIMEMDTAKEAWEAIKSMHMGADRVQRAKVQTLKRELEKLNMKEKESVDEFAARLTTIVSQMRTLGEKKEELEVVEKILRAVSRKFLPIATTIEQFGNMKKMTAQEVFGRLKAFEERVKIYEDDEDQEEHLLLTQAQWRAKEKKDGLKRGKFDKAKVRCYGCDKYGHFSWECTELKEEKKEQALLVMADSDDEPALL